MANKVFVSPGVYTSEKDLTADELIDLLKKIK